MPELPEVETQLRYLRRTALDLIIERVKVSEPRIIKCCGSRAFAAALKGRRMIDARRRGKYLIVSLDNGKYLILHFTMGGDLAYYSNPADKPPYTRIEFFLENKYRLAFTCPRNICRVMVVGDPSEVDGLRTMGPEPLEPEFTVPILARILEQSPSRPIKILLMDQARIAGIGNIYAVEILLESGILPDRPSGSLTPAEVKRLHRAIKQVLGRALGTADEKDFPPDYMVERKMRGDGCRICGAEISITRMGGRSTYFCVTCQT